MSATQSEIMPFCEFQLKPSLFGRARKLLITEEFIEFETSNLLSNPMTRIEKSSFNDVKYLVESIVWYQYRVGLSFRIQIKYNSSEILTIPFARYFWMNKEYGQMYSDISRYIGKYFLSEKIDEVISNFHEFGSMEMPGLKINHDGITFQNPDHHIEWKNVGLKEYYQYFAIFDKGNSSIHKRVTFDEWNAEVLFNVMKTLVAGE